MFFSFPGCNTKNGIKSKKFLIGCITTQSICIVNIHFVFRIMEHFVQKHCSLMIPVRISYNTCNLSYTYELPEAV